MTTRCATRREHWKWDAEPTAWPVFYDSKSIAFALSWATCELFLSVPILLLTVMQCI
jgi:hypothetical protein